MGKNDRFKTAYNNFDNYIKRMLNLSDANSGIGAYLKVIDGEKITMLKQIIAFKNSFVSHGSTEPVAPQEYITFLENELRYVEKNKNSLANKMAKFAKPKSKIEKINKKFTVNFAKRVFNIYIKNYSYNPVAKKGNFILEMEEVDRERFHNEINVFVRCFSNNNKYDSYNSKKQYIDRYLRKLCLNINFDSKYELDYKILVIESEIYDNYDEYSYDYSRTYYTLVIDLDKWTCKSDSEHIEDY